VNGLVSVVVPTRNRAQRLPGAVASVLDQTYRHLEVVIVNDASTDATAEVIEDLADRDERIRVVHLPRRRGAPGARNAGVVAATGEFVALLDDDDRWLPEKVERQVAWLRAHPREAAVSCGYEVVDERASGRTEVHDYPVSLSRSELLWQNFAGSFSFAMCRRAFLWSRQPMDERLPACQDWDFWIRGAADGAVAVLPGPLCRIVLHSEDRVGTAAAEHSGRLRLLERYGEEMSASCRAYHRAHLALLEGTGAARLGRVARALSGGPPWVAVLVWLEWLATRLGRLRGDPAAGRRLVLGLVRPGGASASPRSRAGRMLWTGVAVLATTLVAGVDAARGSKDVLICLLAVGPCLAAAMAGRREAVGTGAWAVVLAVALGFPDAIWGTATYAASVLTVGAVAAFAAWTAPADRRPGATSWLEPSRAPSST